MNKHKNVYRHYTIVFNIILIVQVEVWINIFVMINLQKNYMILIIL